MDLLVTEGDETHSAPCQFPGIQLRAVFFFLLVPFGAWGWIHENGSGGGKRTIRLDEEASRFFFLFFFGMGPFSKANPKKGRKRPRSRLAASLFRLVGFQGCEEGVFLAYVPGVVPASCCIGAVPHGDVDQGGGPSVDAWKFVWPEAATFSGTLGARPTCVQLAVPTLKDSPVWTGVADVARPLDQSAIRLDELERMRAIARNGHGCIHARLGAFLR